MVREIFVPLLRSSSDDNALAAAVEMAISLQAHITALVTLQYPLPLASEIAGVSVDFDQRLLDAARAEATGQVARARSFLARHAVSSEVRMTAPMALWSEQTAALQAQHCDISVIGGPEPGPDMSRFPLTFKSLLLHSGRPVMVIPKGAALKLPVRRAVIAWKPTAQASRAVHDALPLLDGAEIDLLVIDPTVSEHGHGEQPGADIATHLARHGLKVNVIQRPSASLGVGDCLLQHVREADADLLVMGGYGHSHWREVILGGVTHSVWHEASRPVLFSH